MNKADFLIAILLLLTTAVAQAAEAVGKIGYMSGALVAQREDGTIKVLAPKSEVMAGDTLITAKDSYVQIQMNDGAKMTLRPHSNLKIESYRFNTEEPNSDSALFRLIKGGFRTVTGLIGKRGDPDAYKVRSAGATIGIRGTDYSSRLCVTQNCQDDEEPPPAVPANEPPADAGPQPAAPGLYVTVHDGEVIMTQADNALSLVSGQTGFAGPTVLILLPATPSFMNVDMQINLESGAGGSNSPNPSLNQGGCVVQ